MRQLGFVRPNRVVQISTPVLPGFTPAAMNATSEKAVAFIGNFYQRSIGFDEPELESLQKEAMDREVDSTLGSDSRLHRSAAGQ